MPAKAIFMAKQYPLFRINWNQCFCHEFCMLKNITLSLKTHSIIIYPHFFLTFFIKSRR